MTPALEIYRRRWLLSSLILLVAMVCLMLYRNLWTIQEEALQIAPVGRTELLVFPENEPIESRFWHVMLPEHTKGTQADSPILERYQLAGTYLTYVPNPNDPRSEKSTRIAILDDLREKRQVLVREGRTIDAHKVVLVEENRAVLEGPDGRTELWRRVGTGAVPRLVETDPNEGDDERSNGEFFDAPALETNRFGKRIGEDRWIFERKALMGYYDEMMADPKRLVLLYKSFRPDQQDGEVAGYRFATEGEADFFNAVGFQDGDVVRAVNSMQMTSQRRAEFFIGEFVRENLNAIVIEVERDGEMHNLVYLIR